MTTDELDPFEPKEQLKGAPQKPSASQSASLALGGSAPASTVSTSAAPRKKGSKARTPRTRTSFHIHVDPRRAGFAIAFGIGAVGFLFLVTAVALGLSSMYSNRVLPGVRIGSIDVSGMSRAEVIAKLDSTYSYLGQGQVTVTTPVGASTITYQQAGRGPDVEAMADAAMSIGHTGNPIGDTASIVRSALAGQSIPVVVHVDPMALATRVHQVVGSSQVPPQDAQVTISSGTFTFSPSASGQGIDEKAISSAIIERLTQPDAPADLQAGGKYVALDPQVSDKNAQDAIVAAQKMIIDVKLVWNGPPPQAPDPSASPTPIQSATPPKTFTIDAATVRGWIVFGTRIDGTYGPAADPAQVQAYLATLSPKVDIAPREPKVTYDPSGKPVSLIAGKDGAGIDMAATSQAIEAYLDSLVTGGSPNPGSTIAMVTTPIPPRVTIGSLSGMVKIGGWTTTFYPDLSNGNGVNIRLPAANLNGQVVGAGQQFSFLAAVGPIDAAHGFAMGGVILKGRSDHTGAMGGGICSASTTMFNAAARAGLQIDERHAHAYYISRYPLGLDATVYSNGFTTYDLRWTNDTPFPILIRGYSTKGSRSTVTMELWSMPINRTVSFSPDFKANIVKATTGAVQYNISTLKPGQTTVAEYPDDGFDTSKTRTVTDANGTVLHTDTWASKYEKVDGLILVGGSAPPSQTPTPTPGAPTPTPTPGAPTPTPAPATPTPAPTPTPTPTPRRRKVR